MRTNPIISALEKDRDALKAQVTDLQGKLALVESQIARFRTLVKAKAPKKPKEQKEAPAQKP